MGSRDSILAGSYQRFQRFLLTWFIPLLYYLLKTFSAQDLTSKSLIWVQMITISLFWTQNEILVWILSIRLPLHFGKPKVTIFVPKCYTALIFAPKGPYGYRKDCIWTKTLFLNVLTQKYSIMVPTVYVDLVYTILLLFTQNYFLTHFDLKISHLGSNDYPPLILDQNIVLKCFDIEISYYSSKGFCWLGLYNSFTLYWKLFPHLFWLQNLSFESKWLPSACFGPKMKFWFGFVT